VDEGGWGYYSGAKEVGKSAEVGGEVGWCKGALGMAVGMGNGERGGLGLEAGAVALEGQLQAKRVFLDDVRWTKVYGNGQGGPGRAVVKQGKGKGLRHPPPSVGDGGWERCKADLG